MAKARPSTAAPYPRTTYIGNPPVSRPPDWQQLFRNMVADLPGVLAVGGPRPDHLRRRYRGNEICESMPDALQFVIDGAARYYPDVDLRPLRKLLTGLPITPEVLAEAQVAASELAGVALRDRPGKPNAKPPASNPPATATDGPPKGAVFDASSGKLTLDGKVYSLGNSARYVLAILVTKRMRTLRRVARRRRPTRQGFAPAACADSGREEVYHAAARQRERRLQDHNSAVRKTAVNWPLSVRFAFPASCVPFARCKMQQAF